MSEEKKDEKPKKPKVPRQPMPEQDAHVRAKNFEEVTLGYDEGQALLEASRCLQCKKPFCIAGCPVGIDIKSFIGLITSKDYLGALGKIKESSLLPAVCGRVCPQEMQCEKVCVLGKKGDPVAIGRLERFVADFQGKHGGGELPKAAPPTGKKIAVVGGGPSGLTAAFDLTVMGHKVVVFEALHKAGGVLVYGIPEFRLPKAIVEREVKVLEQMGVEIKLDYVIGKIKTIDSLMDDDGFDAVYICNGAGLPWFMGVPGENLNGVFSANEFLTRSNLMKAFDFPNFETPIKRFKNVAVVGGGNVAMDAVRTALRLGADNAYIVYRRSHDELPARKEEVEHAGHEGVQFKLLTAPVRVIGNEQGWVTGMECIEMELGEPDESGRRRPVPRKGSEFVMDVDAVIVSIGTSSNPLLFQTTPGLGQTKKGYIEVENEDTCRTTKKGVFAGGDIVTGSATVILAMGAGRSAARAIDAYVKTGEWWSREAAPRA
ncbi:MAG TPA: NADPH-dependent glutamate synthase [Nitrospirota bacterium]|nr:NADPH-dependent glutamate synthase [Nitrospirota bacterium]